MAQYLVLDGGRGLLFYCCVGERVECDWRYLNYIGEIREGSERVGFEVVTLDGRKGPLASTKTTRYLQNAIFSPFPLFHCGAISFYV